MKKIIGLEQDIIAGKSIGGISLGDRESDIIDQIGDKYTIAQLQFKSQLEMYTLFKIADGAISFTSNKEGIIVSLWCKPPYKGSYNGRLYPGISALELKRISKRQELVKGYLVIDNMFNIYYGMPDDVDDFNCFNDLDNETRFNELYVGNLL